ncbi:MAG: hypothetical protein QW491_14510, partial [Thermoproteota archaeon]
MSEAEPKMPDYERAIIKTKHGMEILRVLGGMNGEATFDQIWEGTGLIKGKLDYYLENEKSEFRSSGVIEVKEDKYRLRHKTPFCWLYDSEVPVTYLGLLGLKDGNPEPQPKTAFDLLSGEGLEIDRQSARVLTTKDALNQWGKEINGLGIDSKHFILCESYEIQSIVEMKRRALDLLEKMRDQIVILDCTALTKPAGMALYEIARDYYFPLIYVYSETGKLKWLFSKKTIKERLEHLSKTREEAEAGSYENVLKKAVYKSGKVAEDLMKILRFLSEKGGAAGLNEIGEQLGYIKYEEIEIEREGKKKKMKRVVEKKGSVIMNRLEKLEKAGIIEKVGKTYKLKYATPFKLFGKGEKEFAYVGLLGRKKREGWEIVAKTTLNLLCREEYEQNRRYWFKEVWILTTPSGYEAWKKEVNELEEKEGYRDRVFRYLFPEEEADDFDAVKKNAEALL